MRFGTRRCDFIRRSAFVILACTGSLKVIVSEITHRRTIQCIQVAIARFPFGYVRRVQDPRQEQ
jgi:hypothetical protein